MVYNETLNAKRYLNEVLEPSILPLANEVCEQFLFMDDNAQQPHRDAMVNASSLKEIISGAWYLAIHIT